MRDPLLALSLAAAVTSAWVVPLMGRALRDEGHLVTTASCALDGQRLLVEQSFDLLIIDYRMPATPTSTTTASSAAAR